VTQNGFANVIFYNKNRRNISNAIQQRNVEQKTFFTSTPGPYHVLALPHIFSGLRLATVKTGFQILFDGYAIHALAEVDSINKLI